MELDKFCEQMASTRISFSMTFFPARIPGSSPGRLTGTVGIGFNNISAKINRNDFCVNPQRIKKGFSLSKLPGLAFALDLILDRNHLMNFFIIAAMFKGDKEG